MCGWMWIGCVRWTRTRMDMGGERMRQPALIRLHVFQPSQLGGGVVW